MLTPSQKRNPLLFSKPTSQSALVWYKNQYQSPKQSDSPGFFNSLFHTMKSYYYDKILQTPETPETPFINSKESQMKNDVVKPSSTKYKLVKRTKQNKPLKSVFLKLLEVYRPFKNDIKNLSQPESQLYTHNQLNSKSKHQNQLPTQGQGYPVNTSNQQQKFTPYKKFTPYQKFITSSSLSQEQGQPTAQGLSHVLKPIALRKTLKTVNKELKRKFKDFSENELEEEEFYSSLRKKTKIFNKPDESRIFPKDLFSKMKTGGSLKNIFDDQEPAKLKAKRGFHEIDDDKHGRSLEETDEGDSLSLKHVKRTPDPQSKEKKLVLSENERNKIIEELEKYFKNQAETLSKEKKVLLSIHLIEESPPRIEIQKRSLTEEKNEITSSDKNSILSEKKEKINEFETFDKSDINQRNNEEDNKNEKIEKCEKITEKEKIRENSQNENISENSQNQENAEIPQTITIPKKEEEKREESIIEEKSEEIHEKDKILLNFDLKSQINQNPFLNSPITMNFTLTDMINSKKPEEIIANAVNFPQIPRIEPSFEFYKPQDTHTTQNLFQPILNNQFSQNFNMNININNTNQLNNFYQCQQNLHIPQNFNIFAHGQQPWELEALNVETTLVDQKAACSLFNNQNTNQNQQINKNIPKKFRSDQQKLRVNSNGVFNL